jgi:hypothetical protein
MSIKTSIIFERTNKGLDIFKRYTKKNFKLNTAFSSPLREDRHPSFYIRYDKKTNKYYFRDFGRDQVMGDAIEFVKLVFKENYYSAIKRIAHDFSINIDRNPKQAIQSKTIRVKELMIQDYQLDKKKINDQSIEYFNAFGIHENILKKYNTISVTDMRLHGKKIIADSNEPIILYLFPWGGKVYRPNSDRRFFYFGEKPKNYIFGLEQLPDSGKTLIITGGEKDVLSFASLGYPAICFNSETSNIDEDLMEVLKKRFRNVIVCYDMDTTGKKASKEHAKMFGLSVMALPLSGKKDDKDISDFIRNGNDPKVLEPLILNSKLSRFDDTIKILQPHTFDEKTIIKKPNPFLTIDDQTILSNGNIMSLGGKVKTGKSSVVYSILAASMTANNTDIDTYGIKVKPNEHKKAVIHFDTEQSEYDLQERLLKTLKKANLLENKPEYFNSYHLLEFPYHERIKFIEEMVEYNFLKHGGVHLVVVDGVADLIKSVNDEEKSNQVVDMFHRLSGQYNCPIILIVHLNPDGQKTRGHLGSQLDRKSESVVLIERNGDISTINPKYCRNANTTDLPLMQFQWDKEAKDHFSIGYKSMEEKEEQKIDEYLDILDEIFDDGVKEMDKTKFKEVLSKKLNIERTATYNLIKFLLDKNLITETVINKNKKTIQRAA